MGFTFETSFGAGDSNMSIASAYEINLPLGESLSGRSDGGYQIMRVFCEFAAGSGSATIALFATENFSSQASGTERKFMVGTATVTGGTVRTDSAGTGAGTANYLGATSFALTSRDTFDLLMPSGCKLYVACTVLSAGAPLYVKGIATRANA